MKQYNKPRSPHGANKTSTERRRVAVPEMLHILRLVDAQGNSDLERLVWTVFARL